MLYVENGLQIKIRRARAATSPLTRPISNKTVQIMTLTLQEPNSCSHETQPTLVRLGNRCAATSSRRKEHLSTKTFLYGNEYNRTLASMPSPAALAMTPN
ncbi:hypothetical protein Nepgr_032729 [Nepenthes gracilis]|uniref:Uncharacterized protein n=1 Tax=Nepenthes gracilis TaxID=150966 RepID=A0AAD3Y8I6_NEPGR|nr:hypothetical protein Nepgr_032729 [Nepenthes gracilis]